MSPISVYDGYNSTYLQVGKKILLVKGCYNGMGVKSHIHVDIIKKFTNRLPTPKLVPEHLYFHLRELQIVLRRHLPVEDDEEDLDDPSDKEIIVTYGNLNGPTPSSSLAKNLKKFAEAFKDHL